MVKKTSAGPEYVTIEKRGPQYLALVAIFALLVAAFIIASPGNITGAATKQQDLNIPPEQCYHIASNLDQAAENAVPYYSSGTKLNPCTGENMPYDSYLDLKKGISRRVFANGDSEGHIMVTSFIVCSDQRAQVTSRIGAHWFNRGHGWGIYYLWQKNPHLQAPFQTERCSTL